MMHLKKSNLVFLLLYFTSFMQNHFVTTLCFDSVLCAHFYVKTCFEFNFFYCDTI